MEKCGFSANRKKKVENCMHNIMLFLFEKMFMTKEKKHPEVVYYNINRIVSKLAY